MPSGRDGEPRCVKIIHAGGVVAGDPGSWSGAGLACSSSGTPAKISGYEFLHAGGERSFASIKIPGSSHCSGRSEPFTVQRVKRVARICGASAFMTAACGGATNARSAVSSSHTESVQNRLAANVPANNRRRPYRDRRRHLRSWPDAGVQQNGVVTVSAIEAARLVLLGGEPLDEPRHLWWNFVSSSAQRIEQAKADWRESRFAMVPGETEFIPLPDEPQRPHMPRYARWMPCRRSVALAGLRGPTRPLSSTYPQAFIGGTGCGR
jgi:hypothetical protein